ncbi:response regulator transcription factor [Pelagicoccus sp. SDUM812003]|uniref:response regulator transcription factor n=1 Tax=Pelagicoccus sp. SDUM812003 TaxID=3041267 RepID=UPI00280C520A|nr:response regulator transcription factor [Pelagicoccus sp. SDUM812003]MDQ8202257.1 response regulator transcription factor [Pelagicoccus sp. SDUM812003]
MRILIVEDESRVARFIEKGFRENAYATSWARSCAEASDLLSEGEYDLIVLDLGLPDGDGLTLLKEWRDCGFEEPVVILSARDSVADRVSGLNLGADDYLPKPFSFDELLARARSLMRRQGKVRQTILRYRNVTLDLLARTARVDEKVMELTNREFALLELLMQNQGRVLTRTTIGERIWEAQYEMQTNLIDVYIRKLRQHLGDEGDPPLIKTVRGVGYMMP